MEAQFVPGTNPVCPWDKQVSNGSRKSLCVKSLCVLFAPNSICNDYGWDGTDLRNENRESANRALVSGVRKRRSDKAFHVEVPRGIPSEFFRKRRLMSKFLGVSLFCFRGKRNLPGNTRHVPPKTPFLKLLFRTPDGNRALVKAVFEALKYSVFEAPKLGLDKKPYY